MKRRDRALMIRDGVLALSATHGTWERQGAHIARIISAAGWTAQLHTAFNPDGPHRVEALRQTRPGRHQFYPNRMCLWPDGLYKTFVVDWAEDRLEVVTYKRGVWEHELFGFDPYSEEELASFSHIYSREHRGKWRS